VMDNGRIIERGNHTALLEKGGRYSEMWQMQQTQNTDPSVTS
jgi:ABC-type multidrug transport system fused ATPase/permease subunit